MSYGHVLCTRPTDGPWLGPGLGPSFVSYGRVRGRVLPCEQLMRTM
jgi:hypothetical protein